MVNSNDLDSGRTIGHSIALAAVGRVPPCNGLDSPNIRETGDRPKSLISFGVEAVDAIRAGEDEGGETASVIGGVVGCSNSKSAGSGGNESEEDGGELHFDNWFGEGGS
jgi:hypothetical protein